LTTKFTQHTYAVRRFVVRYSQTSFRESANTPNKLYSATLLLARLDMFTCSANCKIPRFARNSHLGKMIHPIKEVLRTPAGTAALIKIYFALYLPNLFSCQSSSWENVVGRLSLVVRPTTLINNIFLTRLSGYGSSLSALAFDSKKTKSNTTAGAHPTQCSASKRLSLDRELIHGCRI